MRCSDLTDALWIRRHMQTHGKNNVAVTEYVKTTGVTIQMTTKRCGGKGPFPSLSEPHLLPPTKSPLQLLHNQWQLLQLVCECLLPIDKGLYETKTSHFLCAELLNASTNCMKISSLFIILFFFFYYFHKTIVMNLNLSKYQYNTFNESVDIERTCFFPVLLILLAPHLRLLVMFSVPVPKITENKCLLIHYF